jgi:hypothetical protein
MAKEEDKSGGELTDAPNKKYEQFFSSFKEIDTLEIEKWKPAHLIGYFSKKYYEQYNTPFKFKFNSPSPSKCFEVFQIKKLAQLLSSSSNILKEYIDWIFKEKVVLAKRKITSISFLTNEGVIAEYKKNILKLGEKSIVNRSTVLPITIKELFEGCGTFNTYGDLSFLYQAVKGGGMDETFRNKFNTAMNKAQDIGFNIEVLDKIV